VSQHTTPAGHVFHYVQIPEADRTAIVINWESTWAISAAHPAAAHIGAILMTTGGTDTDPETLISQSSEIGLHAELNATADGARGLLVAKSGRLDEVAALAREALVGSRPSAASFENIRAGLSRNVRAVETPAAALVWNAARRLILGNAPLDDFLRLPVDDIEGATLSEVRAWRGAVFAQANATVAAAGVAPPRDVAAAVDVLLESVPEFPAGEPSRAPQLTLNGRTVLIVAPEAETSAIGVFGPLPWAAGDEGVLNVLAFEVLDRRLARRLHKEFGDAHDITARPANYAREVRLLAIVGEVATADLDEALEATREAYERFRARGPAPREAARGARHVARMFEDAQNVPEAVAQIVMELMLDGEPVEIADDLPARLREIEPRELGAHVEQVFPAWDGMLRIVVAPNAEATAADCVVDTVDALETCR
jgi:predicted Zn-dependent peptidase